jgi:peptidoglycan-associated lipoprotein
MQLNKLLKSLLIAVPVMTLAACGSTSNTDAGNADQSSQTTTVDNSTVEVETVKPAEPTAEELLQQKYDALRQNQIIYFDFDKSTVSGEYVELLQAHADFLVKNPAVKVLVEGHADERGTPEYNIALGERRAQAVAKYLEGLGVSESQISTVSYGEEKPMIKARNEDAFAKNRRAVLVY